MLLYISLPGLSRGAPYVDSRCVFLTLLREALHSRLPRNHCLFVMLYTTFVYLYLFFFVLCDDYTSLRPGDFFCQLRDQIAPSQPPFSSFFRSSHLSFDQIRHLNKYICNASHSSATDTSSMLETCTYACVFCNHVDLSFFPRVPFPLGASIFLPIIYPHAFTPSPAPIVRPVGTHPP